MDEKTEDLRDIFIDTTGAEEVTASQEETPGNLLGGDEDAAAGERVAALVALVDERYGLDTPLSPEEYERVVYGVFDGESDAEMAEAIGVEESAVFGARMDLHLVRDDDREAPFSLDRLRELMSRDVGLPERVDTLDTDEPTVRHYSRVAAADLESTRANHRFRDEFRDLLTDADLAESHAEGGRDESLLEAAEDIESNVSF
ncbi:MAG: hypothetical protein A07HR60_01950 [uncultured archaeon A07HR60]|nr:MAG: hypothetical protein A07HR60_01950 [uncultured archaeon A07HR60]